MTGARILLVCLVVASAPWATLAEESGERYLAHNLWYEKPHSVSAIGYKRGTLVPAGSKVTGVQYSQGHHPGITFTVPDYGVTLTVVVDKHQRDLLTPRALRERLFTDKTLAELTRGFSDAEKNSVSGGFIAPGISKEAAIVAYGYPPLHRTPTTKAPVWIYWTSRLVTKKVRFDSHGDALNGIGN